MSVFTNILSVELHWGIKRFIKKFLHLFEAEFIFPTEILIVYPLLNSVGFSTETVQFLNHMREGIVPDSELGYSTKMAQELINLERSIMTKEPTVVEVRLLEKQIDKLDIKNGNRLCIVDIGCGAGLKAVQMIRMLQSNNITIDKYIAFDSQPLLAKAAALYVYQCVGIKTECVVGNILDLRRISFNLGRVDSSIFLFLGNTLETFESGQINSILGHLAHNNFVILGVRFRRGGRSGYTDVEKLKKFYTQWPSYFLARVPQRFHRYTSFHHLWDQKYSYLRFGLILRLPEKVRGAVHLPKRCWVQIGNPTRFRTIREIEESLQPFCSLISKNFQVTKGGIQDQMVIFILH